MAWIAKAPNVVIGVVSAIRKRNDVINLLRELEDTLRITIKALRPCCQTAIPLLNSSPAPYALGFGTLIDMTLGCTFNPTLHVGSACSPIK
jgi:hypothetical protein